MSHRLTPWAGWKVIFAEIFWRLPPPFFITPWISLFSPLVNDRHDEQPRLLEAECDGGILVLVLADCDRDCDKLMLRYYR